MTMRGVLLLAALALTGPALAAAQAGSCQLDESSGESQINQVTGTIIVPQPLVRCAGGVEIRADRGTYLQNTSEVLLDGNVNYRDPTRTLVAQNATYSSVTGRLYATGNVVVTDAARGSTLRGPEVEYYRAQPGRPQVQVIANGRPHLSMVPDVQRAGTNRGPFEIDGDRMTLLGEDQFSASGRVVIRRSDLDASAADAQYDGVRQIMNLRGAARIKGDRFDLSGETIDATLPGGKVDQVVARERAALTSEKLRLEGPEVQMYFANELLQRLVARGSASANSARPVVNATGFRLEADSLEAILPQQRLDSVVAIGNARGEAYDTAGGASDAPPADRERDWVVGDTIVGVFGPPAAGAAARGVAQDTTPEIRRLVARGDARSLYRVRQEEKNSGGRPGLNYLAGSVIRLYFAQGELDVAQVTGLERGVYLDPVDPTARPANAAPAGRVAPPGRRPGS